MQNDLKKMLHWLRNQRIIGIISYILLAASSFMMIAYAEILQGLTNGLADQNLQLIRVYSIALILALLLNGSLAVSSKALLARFHYSVLHDMRVWFFDRINIISLDCIYGIGIGRILTYYNDDIKALARFAVYAVKQNFSNPFAFVGPLRSSLKQLDLFKDRLSSVFTYETEANDEFQHLKEFPVSQDAVVLRNATFGYDNDKDILNDLSLIIKQGARVKIIGESGSGKTTLFRILMKLYDLNDGDLEILGSDIKKMTGKACRDFIAYIPQCFTIFHDTIKNKICLGDPNPNEEKMIKAASSVMMHDFIMELPHQYETVLYDNGKNLSAGQRARLAAARALYREAPILLIDELAANIDAGTRNKLIRSIISACSNSTILFISHHIDDSYPIDLEVEVS